jgi:Skp family chaperone for outer membrane proteins
MSKFLSVFFIFLFASPALAFGKLAFIDIKRIESEAIVTKNLKKSFEDAGAKLDKEVEKERAQFEKKVEQFKKAAATLTNEANDKKQLELQAEAKKIELKLQSKATSIEEAKRNALDKINEKIKVIAEKISAKEGYEAVLTSTFVIYYPTSADITKSVISNLDKEMKTVPFSVK